MPEKSFVNMKMPARKADGMAEAPSAEKPQYPYGLSIRLNKASLAKLGLTADNFKISGEMEFTAKATVDSISKSANDRGRDNQDVSLQITDVKVNSLKGEVKTLKTTRKSLSILGKI